MHCCVEMQSRSLLFARINGPFRLIDSKTHSLRLIETLNRS
jgi:hypothetical protein